MYLTMSVVSTPFCIKSDLWSLIFDCRKKKIVIFFSLSVQMLKMMLILSCALECFIMT